MKNIFDCLSLSFLIVGTIIGAGFITGAEIQRFFGGGYIISSAYIAFLCFCILIGFFLELGARFGSVETVNKSLLGKGGSYISVVVFIGAFMIAVAMLSAVDSLFSEYCSFPKKIPIMSVLSLFLATFVCKKGINGLALFNFLFLPVLLVCLFVFLFLNNDFDFSGEGGFERGALSVLYASMNLFLSAPVFFAAGKRYGKKIRIYSTLISSVVLCLSVLLIGATLNSDVQTKQVSLPLLLVFLKHKSGFWIFFVCSLIGILTTLLSAVYPLLKQADKHNVKACYRVLISIFALFLSMLGFKNIVHYVYPFFGIAGLIYSIVLFFRYEKLSVYKFPFDKRNKRVHTPGEQA